MAHPSHRLKAVEMQSHLLTALDEKNIAIFVVFLVERLPIMTYFECAYL